MKPLVALALTNKEVGVVLAALSYHKLIMARDKRSVECDPGETQAQYWTKYYGKNIQESTALIAKVKAARKAAKG